tara:strand:+ start:772 stop:924 length:153 start_codon:yes stop_codon:yes gene_type:complete
MHPETVSHSLKHDYFALVARVVGLAVELMILVSRSHLPFDVAERLDLWVS